MSKVRYYIESKSIQYQEVFPIWDGTFKWSKKEGQIFYRKEISKDITFKGTDFTLLSSLPIFEEVTFFIERFCKDHFDVVHSANFAILNCKIDYDKSTISVTPESNDLYKCPLDEFKNEVYFFNCGSSKSVSPFQGNYEITTASKPGSTNDLINGTYPSYPIGNFGTGWWIKENKTTYAGSGSSLVFTTFWERIISKGENNNQPPNFGTGWILVDAANNNWAKKPDTNDYNIKPIFNGREFQDVLRNLFVSQKCQLTIISNFFDCNSDGTAPNNSYYKFANDNLKELLLFQKSDVKRPSATNKSTHDVWKMKPITLLEDLQKMFNVYWVIVNGVLRIEHLSYFESTNIQLLSDAAFKNQIAYEDGQSIPKSEIWNWSDGHRDYIGVHYPNGTDEKEYKPTYFNNHLSSVQDEQQKDKRSDAGFVLVATKKSNGVTYIINNELLYWRSLVENCHTYARYYVSGAIGYNLLNGITNFENPMKIKKQPKFTIPNPCDMPFDPRTLYQTPLGVGSVDSATENIMLDNVELELKY